MKNVFIVLCLSVFVLFSSCRFWAHNKEYVDYGFFDEGPRSYPDQMIIPDKYNTGVNPDIPLIPYLSETKIGDLFITIRGDTNQYMIAPKKGNMTVDRNGTVTYEIPDVCVVENYDFSAKDFICQNCNEFTRKKTVIFKNCKFNKFRNPPDHGNNIWIEFEHCTFTGNVSEAQISLNYCYIGGFTSDAMNPTRHFKCKNSYVADLLNRVLDKEVHIDGFQIFGRKGVEGGYIYFDNVRFEIPSIHYEGQHPKTGVNACVMFQLEYGPACHCVFQNLYINGGGKWFPIYLKRNPDIKQNDITLRNAFVSNNFGEIFYTKDRDTNAKIENVDHHDNLYVSSVWKDNDGKTHVICTNDTMYKSTLLVKTNKGDFNFEIPRCPSNWNLGGEYNGKMEDASFINDENSRPYIEYRFEDLPFDVDCIIEEDVSYVKCFDKENEVQIRYVEF